jgi:hypothetical protein
MSGIEATFSGPRSINSDAMANMDDKLPKIPYVIINKQLTGTD